MQREPEVSEHGLPGSVATLVTPARANGAGVILAHGGTDDGRRFFAQAAVHLARPGYTVATPATRMRLEPEWPATEASIRRAVDVHRAALDRFDPAGFLERPHRVPVLLQFGYRDDVIGRGEAEALSAAAAPPVTTRWYACGHGIDADPAAQVDRERFFDEHLAREDRAHA